MTSEERRTAIQAEQTKGLVRALHQSELQAAGARRAVALHAAEQELDRIARRIPEALQAGLSMSEVSRLTGISRQTLYELKGRYGSVKDLRLAVLQSLALERSTATELADRLGRSRDEISPILDEFEANEWIEGDVREYLDGGADWDYGLLIAGMTALENWTFDDE